MHLLIYCAGGFGMEIMDIARRVNRGHGGWQGIAFADDKPGLAALYGADVFCFGDALAQFGASGLEVVIASGEPFVRKALRAKVESAGIRLATLVDDTAVVSETASIGAGTVLSPGCFVSSMATVGSNVAVVAGALIGHHANIGDNCVISGHVNIGGGCVVGSESYVGMGAQLRERTNLGWATIVGMGSIVYNDIPAEMIALGNPCRPIRPNTEKKVFG
jgi:sugar O-acyltransferase (sialic acid O-acetyltransferase NeuD family)